MAPEQPGKNSGALGGDVSRFAAFLKESGLSCLLIEQSDGRAELRFIGPFEGREVVWHCEFITLTAEFKRLAQKVSPAPERLRNFIEIGEPESGGVPIRVGLALTCIDTAAIDKMMLMIRRYKNLRRGRHEYGEAINPLPSPRSAQDR